ncbi:MAG: SagB/ThcOx family dehydrogenase [Desulfurococcales archaeon]|nr:SagB/ThcOx family dehydrogenase [Desulfurococcales archaeon]MCE4605620.1 SagB/ThcOx family dehydrogenase [Desulfurococcales archaeon]
MAMEALSRLLRLVGRHGSKYLEEGLREAVEMGGDVSRIYHRVGMLYRDYYGDVSPPSGDRGYYKEYPSAPLTRLPDPLEETGVDVLQAIRSRRSRRRYSREPLSLEEVSTVLYHAVGITGRALWGGPKRAYPSSGALQPVEVYASVHRISGLEPGLYHYNPRLHGLELLRRGDYSRVLASIALDQDHVSSAPLVLILTAVYSRTLQKYGQRSYRYVHWDTGFAGENIYLACEGLGLATVAVGAFYDEEICQLLNIDCRLEIPMLLFPVGRRG